MKDFTDDLLPGLLLTTGATEAEGVFDGSSLDEGTFAVAVFLLPILRDGITLLMLLICFLFECCC